MVKASSDETLAREAKEGSLPAFEALVRRHDARIYAYCRYRTGQAEDARDLAQQTFINALRKLNKYKCHKAFSPWLFTIARNLCTDHLRRRRETIISEEQDWVAPDNPADLIESADIWTELRRHLNETEFTTLWLVYQQGLEIREAATVIRKSAAATKVLLSRARQHLRQVLEPDILQSSKRPPIQTGAGPIFQPNASYP
ncbi:MAG: RNA polymerase sigma factor [Opitutales bacterium]